MDDFDATWENPPEAQAAALTHAVKYAQPFLRKRSERAHRSAEFYRPITEFDVAEMMCIAEHSLWYSQAKLWSQGESYPAQGADKVFRLAGLAIVKLVELGYSDGKWWDVEQAFDSPSEIALSIVSILDAVRMLREVRMRSVNINSQWFEALPYLIAPGLNVERAIKRLGLDENAAKTVIYEIMGQYDPDVKKMVLKASKQAKQKLHETYDPAACIHPGCDNLVAPTGIAPRAGHHKNYRGTGACKRGHHSYLCTKCNRPHSFTSKIGQKHYPEFYGGDFDKQAADQWKETQE